MATETNFREEVNKLVRNFGLRIEASENRVDIIWEKFKHVDDKIWKDACDCLLENEDRFPTIKKMRDAINEVYNKQKGKDEQVVECERCEGYGLITMWKDDCTYAFRCNCENGQRKTENILFFSWDLKDKGFLTREECFILDK